MTTKKDFEVTKEEALKLNKELADIRQLNPVEEALKDEEKRKEAKEKTKILFYRVT